MRRPIITVLVLISIVCLSACSRTRPILEITDHQVPLQAQKLSLANIGQNMAIAGGKRHWQFVDQGPGRLQATYSEDDHVAVVDITFTQHVYSIHLDHSSGLMQRDNEIHHNYNRWINQLQVDIDQQLAAAAMGQR